MSKEPISPELAEQRSARRLEMQRARRARNRQSETPEERAARLAKAVEYRASRPPDARERKSQQDREYKQARLANETPEGREARLAKVRARDKQRKAEETPEEREQRLARKRAQEARRRARNPVHVNALARARYAKDPEPMKAYQRQRRLEKPDLVREEKRQERERNRESYAARDKAKWTRRYNNEPEFRLSMCLRRRIYMAIKNHEGKPGRADRVNALLGCTIPQLQEHLERQFQPGMTWDNYGHKGWHVDHVRPCASFDLTDPAQQRECFNWRNLQPLWWHENLAKGARELPLAA